MKIQDHGNKLETNVQNETQEFGIGDASVVIEILRNRLYEHKIRTSVQEYICNARDAMRECGKGNDFEVTVPTRLNPVFKVRDFGPGISPDRIRNVFVMYGASTKRNTNGQTGGFGIGAKSAWSYTDSFTIVTIVDGTRRTYVAHTGVNNNGRLDLVSTDATDEANGTEIQIAVKEYDINEFRSAIFRAIYFWKEKPVLKGELNPPTLVSGLAVSDTLEVIDKDLLPEYVRPGYDEAVAVIDGIVYPLTAKIIQKVSSLVKLEELVRKSVILHFGNGVVEVGASRESIADSKITLAALEKLGSRALLESQTFIADAFSKISDTSEYLKKYAELSKLFNADKYAKYGDYSINSSVIHNPLMKKVRMTLVHCMGKHGRGRVDKITKDELTESRSEISIDHLGHLFFVNTQENKQIQNKRIREYFKKNTHMIMLEMLDRMEVQVDAKGQAILDAEKKPVMKQASYPKEYKKLCEELGAQDFLGLTYVDPPKVVRAKVARTDAEICLHVVNGGRHKYTTLATNSQKWIFVRLEKGMFPHKHQVGTLRDLEYYTTEKFQTKICGLTEKVAKIVQGDPNFIELKDWLAAFKPNKDFMNAAKNSICKNQGHANALFGLGTTDDDFLNEMVAEYRAINKAKAEIPDLLTGLIEKDADFTEFKEKDEKFGKLMSTHYPLVEELGTYSRNKKELVFYINSKFATLKPKKK